MHSTFRFFLVVFALLVIVFAGTLLAFALGWAIPLNYLLALVNVTDDRWIIGAVSALVMVLALQMIIMVLRGRRRYRELMIQETALGRVDISVPALEDMIRRASRHVREIREIRPSLRYERDGVIVILHLNVNPEANLPAISQEVQQVVQNYLEEKAGIHVLQVQVLIESVSFEPRTRVE